MTSWIWSFQIKFCSLIIGLFRVDWFSKGWTTTSWWLSNSREQLQLW